MSFNDMLQLIKRKGINCKFTEMLTLRKLIIINFNKFTEMLKLRKLKSTAIEVSNINSQTI